jgi:hypothetical protein
MYAYTSLVINPSNSDCVTYYYRLRDCDTNMNSNTPANIYQKQKIIQNTVRVPSSLYTMNLAALSTYAKPNIDTYNVCWNQMSDRPHPSSSISGYVPTGYNNSSNTKHHSVTSSRPGGQAPGGIGCDIKHNSYDRYLNRLKGKGPLRRGDVVTPVTNIPFNRAFPIYGGKTMKTSIVSGCNCPVNSNKSQDSKIYDNPNYQPFDNDPNCIFSVGQFVYAKEAVNGCWLQALITDYDELTTLFTVKFVINNLTKTGIPCDLLRIYYPCSQCVNDSSIFDNSLNIKTYGESLFGIECNKINTFIQQIY